MGLRESLNKLAGHFEVKETDAPDVVAYKETMLEGFGSLSSDVQDLDALTCSPTGADRANVEGS